MSELIWLDRFTGTRYRCDARWRARVRDHLTDGLRGVLEGKSSVKGQADAAAHFWRDTYYQQVFPLRFGRVEEGGRLQDAVTVYPAPEVDLGALSEKPLRQEGLLDGDCLPPILPDESRGEAGWLLADRLLIGAALLNVLLAQTPQVESAQQHAVRLAALVYPFLDKLADVIADAPLVKAVAQALAGQAPALPTPLKEVVYAVRDGTLGERRLDIVLVAVQRVKQYVFETPGLNEIRGASTLLDEITDDLQRLVGAEIGPEVVLRAAGATLLFLTPASDGSSPWPARLREAFYRRTGIAFPAAAAVTVDAQVLLTDYGRTVSRVYDAMVVDRAQAVRPDYAALPFEARCDLCRIRPAEGWDAAPEGGKVPESRRLLCRACKTKRDRGQDERRGRVYDALRWMGYAGRLDDLGIRPKDGWLAQDLESLIPRGVRRKLIGVAYGDGNNFGRVSLELPDIALGLQWSKRAEQTTQAAAALALGRATQRSAALLGWQSGSSGPLEKVPFQVLALGGDDLSLFAWAPVAVYFAAEFAHLTDLEFQATSSERLSQEPLTFSQGVLVTDEKTPVARSVNFTEHELMRWAKQASKSQGLTCGNVAMLYAQTAEAMPSELDQYRREIYLLGHRQEVRWPESVRHFRLCTTLRPWTADELEMLLAGAEHIVKKGHLGRLQRLTAAFYGTRQGLMAGLLYYAYQKGRASRNGAGSWIQELEEVLAAKRPSLQSQPLLAHYPLRDNASTLFGLAEEAKQKDGAITWHAPLLDLLELAKLMS